MKTKPTFLLDTNICIYTINEKPRSVVDRVRKCRIDEICISTVTAAELEYGIQKSKKRSASREALLRFLAPFRIIEFSSGDAHEFGKIRAYLEKNGMPIGPFDLQIAAQALSRNLILVTNNEKEFERVPNISIQNWTKPG